MCMLEKRGDINPPSSFGQLKTSYKSKKLEKRSHNALSPVRIKRYKIYSLLQDNLKKQFCKLTRILTIHFIWGISPETCTRSSTDRTIPFRNMRGIFLCPTNSLCNSILTWLFGSVRRLLKFPCTMLLLIAHIGYHKTHSRVVWAIKIAVSLLRLSRWHAFLYSWNFRNNSGLETHS